MDHAFDPAHFRPASGRGRDSWVPMPALAATACVAILLFLCSLPGQLGFILIPLTFFALLAAPIAVVVISIALALKRRPRRAVSALLILVLPILLWGGITWIDDCLHMWLTESFGFGQVGTNSRPDQIGFSTADWSTGLAGGPSTFLIHDLSDQVALPVARHSHPDPLEGGIGEDCSGTVRHLLGHYYVCRIQF